MSKPPIFGTLAPALSDQAWRAAKQPRWARGFEESSQELLDAAVRAIEVGDARFQKAFTDSLTPQSMSAKDRLAFFGLMVLMDRPPFKKRLGKGRPVKADAQRGDVLLSQFVDLMKEAGEARTDKDALSQLQSMKDGLPEGLRALVAATDISSLLTKVSSGRKRRKALMEVRK